MIFYYHRAFSQHTLQCCQNDSAGIMTIASRPIPSINELTGLARLHDAPNLSRRLVFYQRYHDFEIRYVRAAEIGSKHLILHYAA